ncbi:hypothetical protein SAMD00023353_3600650 [Rosellinia necatrix]|uniref:C2H2-type domain-containing protein n=1 Tax=Rosellinia necatrix TaxID=77044 RepID=A0A1W2TN45_ROSNE|nr:hypothetical protein SAMD00023353_3600650 [Rosellinia necatrix]
MDAEKEKRREHRRRERRRLDRERSRERFEREKERERHDEIPKQQSREQAKSIQSRSTSSIQLMNFPTPTIPFRPDTPDSTSRGGSQGLKSLRGTSKNATGFEHLEQVTISRDNTADEKLRRSASFAYLGSKLAVCHETSLKPKSIRATLPAGTQNTIQAISPAVSANVLRGGTYICPHKECQKSFPGQHHLKTHMYRVHGSTPTVNYLRSRIAHVEDADDDDLTLFDLKHADEALTPVRDARSWNENDIRYHPPPLSEAIKGLGRAGLSSSHIPRLFSTPSVASTRWSRTPAPASDSRSRKRMRSPESSDMEPLTQRRLRISEEGSMGTSFALGHSLPSPGDDIQDSTAAGIAGIERAV